MQVMTYRLDGAPDGVVELRRDGGTVCWVDGQEVLAISLWGQFVALTLLRRLVLVRPREFERLIGYRCASEL